MHPDPNRTRRRPAPATPSSAYRAGPRDQDEPRLYTPAEAAALLRVPESRLRRRAARRQIPRTFLGKHLSFSADDLTAIITAAAQPATTRRRAPRPPHRTSDLPPPGSHASITTAPDPITGRSPAR